MIPQVSAYSPRSRKNATVAAVTSGQRQMAAAHAARRRQYEEKLATILRDRGWTVTPPEPTTTEGQP